VKKDGRYTCEPFEFPVASLDEVFVFHLGIVNLQDTFAKGLLLFSLYYDEEMALNSFFLNFNQFLQEKKSVI